MRVRKETLAARSMPEEPTPRATSEQTEEELQRAYQAYVRSKTVDGRYCPTPELEPELESELEPKSSPSRLLREGTKQRNTQLAGREAASRIEA